MFQALNNAKNAYGKVGLDIGVEVASPHKLIVMLYDGALVALATAQSQLAAGDKMGMSASITKASNIIDQGLRDSLDRKAGGELAERLAALYDYMGVRLQLANVKADATIIDEIVNLLKELRSAWEEIAGEAAALSANGAGA